MNEKGARLKSPTMSARLSRLYDLWRLVITQTIYRPLFGRVGSRSRIYPPMGLLNTEFVHIGRGVTIRSGLRLEVVLHDQAWVPIIEIHDRVNIEQNVHIICHGKIVIGSGTLITGGCAIVDVTHPHSMDHHGITVAAAIDPSHSQTIIGSNTFVGFGTTILPNVRIGDNCYIGARSVVTGDIPDGSIAVGAPAKVIGSLANQQ